MSQLSIIEKVQVQKGAAKAPPINIRFTRPSDLSTTGQTGNIAPADSISASAITVSFSPPIVLDPTKKWEVVPYGASVPYTVPNIGPAASGIPGYSNGNNRLSISWNNAIATYTDYYLPAGLYGVADLQLALNMIAVDAGWIADTTTAPLFICQGISATQQLILSLSPGGLSGSVFPANGVKISFENPSLDTSDNDSMGPVLGFDVTGAGSLLTIAGGGAATVSFTAPNRADFAQLTQMVINSNIVTGSYVNGISSGAMLSVNTGDHAPNSIIAVTPPFPAPVPVSQVSIGSASFWITDQSGRMIEDLGESWSLVFSIREVQTSGS